MRLPHWLGTPLLLARAVPFSVLVAFPAARVMICSVSGLSILLLGLWGNKTTPFHDMENWSLATQLSSVGSRQSAGVSKSNTQNRNKKNGDYGSHGFLDIMNCRIRSSPGIRRGNSSHLTDILSNVHVHRDQRQQGRASYRVLLKVHADQAPGHIRPLCSGIDTLPDTTKEDALTDDIMRSIPCNAIERLRK
ncbi:hypothetical protein BO86DRAFT_378394 [Aspergillus japonicus CBS 114.51]|uniref:Uncharacterized protein n=1 Tax=Aspergillus japonicus CBS 114.51 TaxID=1448312 RepID=A0A8T8X4N4_ASPJA|nr:hypothetical protein BO86DRAFT_378394 [Aspergillus japonicus CBS 114.51]RAH82890.1 hypothetical protein BO86DRAFT_378394 [Aspergillus japonicus CBS 114.51]